MSYFAEPNRTSIGQNETKQDTLRQIFRTRNIITPYKSILFLISNPKNKKNRTKQDKTGHFQFSHFTKGGFRGIIKSIYPPFKNQNSKFKIASNLLRMHEMHVLVSYNQKYSEKLRETNIYSLRENDVCCLVYFY
ncbi:MAG: hypothetical protein A2X61_05155 [Ignavibacteria bacterium GWB2_35_12]|nr:MAG: hypothetical protein A2X63_02720 [Ignavibacteria bacterium GWA2_35_8]OGU42333.1 MAG: hypothetical protein A2X61_05155 [Ignavibacteria bacterium GWB2_35_12]OGU96963.1 MAG: hypothetical protein A2220_10010 [Ignavibacteria bacterium RIFOXYA2_FULL_35_10]OGV18561.1 MAG: hypothetical protein A2475_01845 [Ignavibacteria bacterium RIFOXYC2_FULL_35_21]